MKNSTPSPPRLSALAVVAVVIANCSEWAWSTVYFGTASATMVSIALVCNALMTWWIAIRLPSTPPARTAALAWLGLWWGYRVLAPQVGMAAIGLKWHWIAVSALGGLAFFVSRRAAADTGERLAAALMVASLLFVGATPIKGLLMSLPHGDVFHLAWLERQSSARNTVVVLFDELSPEVTAPLVSGLQDSVANVRNTTISSVGQNTVNVIPAMLTGKGFDDFEPCGSATLCSSHRALDMGRLHAPSQKVDVIGFHMPYCAIAGLRSCGMLPWSRLDPLRLEKSLLCNLFAELGCEAGIAAVRVLAHDAFARYGMPEVPTPVAPAASWRAELTRLLDAAPFWNQGGVLYIHMPLPHLPASRPTHVLETDYMGNVREVQDITRELLRRLNTHFDGQYLLVLTSDHPLRVDMYCSQPEFAGPQCRDGLPVNRGRVPMILASPQTLQPVEIGSNLGLLQ